MCGASIPPPLGRKLEAAGDDREAGEEIGVEWAVRQCEDLLERGAPGVHFYTLNKSPAARMILTALRVRGFHG
jgi:methylenetetrahydrofolate reductase (NADH)